MESRFGGRGACGQLDFFLSSSKGFANFCSSVLNGRRRQEKNVKRIRLQIFNFKEEVTISNFVEEEK